MSTFAKDRTEVALHPHDPAWADLAAQYSAALATVLGDTLVVIEHIGSTAIPGISAKPVIDLMPVVSSLEAVDVVRPRIEALGYVWKGEFGLAGRRYCTMSDPATGARLVHVHILQRGSGDVDRMLAFRDYLRAHPDEAHAYEREKQRAAALHPNDSLAYNEEKSAWIKECERRAFHWSTATP